MLPRSPNLGCFPVQTLYFREILTYCDVFECCSALYGTGEAVRGCRLSLETYHLLWCLKFGFETVIPDFLPDYPLNGGVPCSLRACSRSELRSDIWSQELRCSHREQARNEIMVAALTCVVKARITAFQERSIQDYICKNSPLIYSLYSMGNTDPVVQSVLQNVLSCC